MKLSDQLLDKFIALYEARFDIKLTRGEAIAEAEHLLRFAITATEQPVEENTNESYNDSR